VEVVTVLGSVYVTTSSCMVGGMILVGELVPGLERRRGGGGLRRFVLAG